MKPFFRLAIVFVSLFSCSQLSIGQYTVTKGNVTYDFTFAELAIKYIESADTSYLLKIAETEAAKHILNHANAYNYNVPKSSTLALVKYLLTPIEESRKKLPDFKRNLVYAKDSIAQLDLPQQECLNYLPANFHYANSTHLFFTFGYDLGVTYAGNSSVNLAHPHYSKYKKEIRYYAIHELHHAGFLQLKNDKSVSLDVHTYAEMTKLIAYLTHLEGMGTYTPLAIRQRENAMNTDKDYIVLQDSATLKKYEREYFDIYFHFKNNPQNIITDEDWDKVNILSDKKRLWYTIGALMAKTIDEKLGREKLTSLISGSSEEFINTYLLLTKEPK